MVTAPAESRSPTFSDATPIAEIVKAVGVEIGCAQVLTKEVAIFTRIRNARCFLSQKATGSRLESPSHPPRMI